jgi:hypothetical protein
MKRITAHLVNIFLVVIFFFLPISTTQALSAVLVQQPSAVVIADDSNINALYNTNLVPDGDAEADYSTWWVDNEGFTQILPYGASCGGMCNFPSPYDEGPVLRGTSFFYMGTTTNRSNGTNLWIKNKLSLAPIQEAIDTGKVGYILSGYFGGDTNSPWTAQFHIFFEPDSGPSIDEVIVGNVTPEERQNKTGLSYREKTGYIPAGTRYINLLLQSGDIYNSNYRTGFADNLSLILIPLQTYLPITTNGKNSETPPKTGFPAPSGVFVTPNGLTRMDIYWTDNSTNELGFIVQRINQDWSVDTICNTKPNVTYCFDPGLSQSAPYGYIYLGNNTTYTYQVRAVGEGINSAWANGTGTTATEPLTPPSPVHGDFTCQAIDVTSSSATFVWNDPFDYEAGFNLYVGGNPYPSWSMIEGGTKITFINQPPGSITLRMVPFVYDRNNPGIVYESPTSCIATAILPSPPDSGITYFFNNASYPVISLVVDGWEQFPVRPLGILSGAYYELDEVPSGEHSWIATTGFWDDWGQRFEMYIYTGEFTQPTSGSYEIHIPDMTIYDLLTVPPANLGYWEGYYFDSYGNCYTTAFQFNQNGTYDFYNANNKIDHGTYTLVEREPAIFSTKFHVSSSLAMQNVDGLLVETQGQFYMKNGPSSWPQITYVYKPQGYVHNPFCP